MTDLLQQAFPEAYFDEKHLEWRIDWDERQFPTQGQRLDEFSTTHNLEVFHRYRRAVSQVSGLPPFS